MSFWIEVNAAPVSPSNSADLLVYLVKKGKTISFFNSDWRSSADVELVGTINRADAVSHTHTGNSSHHLISLATNLNSTVSTGNLDISGDFWVVIYNTSPNTARGWNLRYQPSSLCNNTNRWYLGNFSGWTTTPQSGCPDTHFHIARRDANKDGVKVDITAGAVTSSSTFYFNTPANLAPNGTSFIVPMAGAYSGPIDISWDPTSDANGDVVIYKLFLEDGSGGVVSTLETSYSLTSRTWASSSVPDGNYQLHGQACDATLCTDYYSENFTVLNNPTSSIYSLTGVSISTNGSSSIAKEGETVTLSFTASGVIGSPQVNMYSGGDVVTNTVNISNVSGNTWNASYVVDAHDTLGAVTFSISATNLDANYFDTTDSTAVIIGESETLSESVETSSVTSNSTPACGDEKPSQAPDLFQIDSNQNSTTLFFTPISNTSKYYISFSEKPNAEEHGEEITLQKDGVQKHTVYHLKANTKYYFKVRGSIGCMPGAWSNVLANTTSKSMAKVSSHRYFPSLLNRARIFTKNIQNNTIVVPDKPELINTLTPTIPVKMDEKPTEKVKKKFCFLWWCI